MTDPIIQQIDDWYSKAPAGSSESEVVEWVQYNSEIPCPLCGDWLFVIRTSNAGDRGMSYLALCQNPECNFQLSM